jgi:DNA repair exonuclease SbcCD ATPase subunit
MESEKLYVLEARIRDMRSISLVALHPNEKGVTEIKGANGQGKSTVLDSFFYTLAGGKLPNGIVKNGSDSASIEITIGNSRKVYNVTKTISADGKTSLQVLVNNEGVVKSAQSFLQDIAGAITFSPADFYEMMKSGTADSSRKIRDKLLEVGGIPMHELRNLEEEKKSIYDERTLTNRELKKLESVVSQNPEPVEEVNIVDLSNKVEKAREECFSLHALIVERESFEEQDIEIRAKIEELKTLLVKHSQMADELPKLREMLSKAEAEGLSAKKEMELASQTNTRALQYKEWVGKSNEYKMKSAEHEKLDAQYKAFDKRFEALFANCKLPRGLQLGEEITYNGVLLEQLSDSEKMKLAFEIAIAQKPELPLVLMEGGERFDSHKRAEIHRIAEEMGVQVLLEVVDDSDPKDDGAVWIVEGHNA